MQLQDTFKLRHIFHYIVNLTNSSPKFDQAQQELLPQRMLLPLFYYQKLTKNISLKLQHIAFEFQSHRNRLTSRLQEQKYPTNEFHYYRKQLQIRKHVL